MVNHKPTLAQLSKQVHLLHAEIHALRALIEDQLLSPEESRFLSKTLDKLESGDESGFEEFA